MSQGIVGTRGEAAVEADPTASATAGGANEGAAVETAPCAHGPGRVWRRVLGRLARAWSALVDRLLGKLWSLMD